MSTKCIAIGDPHFQVSTIPQAQILINKIHCLVDNLQNDLDFIVILGDLLHTHEKIHVSPFKLATEFIVSLAEKLPVYLIIGNHDYCNNQQFLTENHAFNSFKKIPNVTICDKVIIDTIKGHKFGFCPYTPPEQFEKALNTVNDWKDCVCIFAHQEFYGCRFNPTMTSIDGDVWDNENPLVISGHIHDSQWLQDNIYYVGSSMQHAFGESADKTIAYIKFKKSGDFKLKKIDLELQKKRIIYKDIKDLQDYVPPNEENTAIKLVIKGNSQEFKVFRKSLNYKRLISSNIKISFMPISTPTPELELTTNKKSVIEILTEMISNESEHVKLALKEVTF